MKNINFLFIVCLLNVCCVTRETNSDKEVRKGNPVFPGWYADPEAVIFDSTYWIYPTYSDEFDKQVFLDAFSSNDLVHWKKHERIIDTTNVRWAKRAMWAPATIRKDGRYFLFFSANDVHEGEVGGIGVAVSDKPEGPFHDHLGKPLINEIANGAQPIDQYVFQGTDKSYYMIYGGWGHCNIVKLKEDFTGLVPFEDGQTFREITPKGYVEGPIIFQRNSKYYFMWSEGGWGGPDYRVAYAISESPFGPFERIGTVLQQDTTVATGAGHHSVIKHPVEDKWFIVYHRRPLNETAANSRHTCIDKMEFDQNGMIKPVKITFEGVEPLKLK
jgi:beta-xylosidase